MKSGEALQIGGGNIGRALIGEVMHNAGLHVVFADVNQGLIDSFNQEHGYPINVVSLDGSREAYIDDVEAVSSLDETVMIEKIVSSDIITTAVGSGVLAKIAPTLAKGLMERYTQRPSDEIHVVVVACENIENNTGTLKNYILDALPDDEWRSRITSHVSFPDCAVDRIVPNASNQVDHPLGVVTEDYFQLAVDKTALIADMPDIEGIELVSDLEAVLAQKLFTLNGAHAAMAYWGYISGYETIDEAMGDANIRSLIEGLLSEVSVVITAHYPSISEAQQTFFSNKILRRFMNPYLKDEPKRVGRDPKRKLHVNDRLLKPAILAIDDGQYPSNLSMAIVGGFRFDNPEDAQAVELRNQIESFGLDETVVAVTGLSRLHPLVGQTTAAYHFSELLF